MKEEKLITFVVYNLNNIYARCISILKQLLYAFKLELKNNEYEIFVIDNYDNKNIKCFVNALNNKLPITLKYINYDINMGRLNSRIYNCENLYSGKYIYFLDSDCDFYLLEKQYIDSLKNIAIKGHYDLCIEHDTFEFDNHWHGGRSNYINLKLQSIDFSKKDEYLKTTYGEFSFLFDHISGRMIKRSYIIQLAKDIKKYNLSSFDINIFNFYINRYINGNFKLFVILGGLQFYKTNYIRLAKNDLEYQDWFKENVSNMNDIESFIMSNIINPKSCLNNTCFDYAYSLYKNKINYNCYNEILKEKNVVLSVVMPVYNNEEYLVRCLDSLLNPNKQPLFSNMLHKGIVEVILLNDRDNRINEFNDIIDNYVTKNNLTGLNIFKYVNANYNYGFYTRCKLIKLAKGKYIATVDPDDIFLDNVFEQLINNMIISKQQTDVFEMEWEYDIDDLFKHNELTEKYYLKYKYNTYYSIKEKLCSYNYDNDLDFYTLYVKQIVRPFMLWSKVFKRENYLKIINYIEDHISEPLKIGYGEDILMVPLLTLTNKTYHIIKNKFICHYCCTKSTSRTYDETDFKELIYNKNRNRMCEKINFMTVGGEAIIRLLKIILTDEFVNYFEISQEHQIWLCNMLILLLEDRVRILKLQYYEIKEVIPSIKELENYMNLAQEIIDKYKWDNKNVK